MKSLNIINVEALLLYEIVSKTHKRLKRTLFNWTRQNARIFEEVHFFEATHNWLDKLQMCTAVQGEYL